MGHERNATALDDGEIKKALEGAGYALELRVFRQFDQAGMDPQLSFRCQVDEVDPHTKEIDVVAQLNRRQPFVDAGRGLIATIDLISLVEVKKMHHGCFVGILGREASAHERRTERAPCAGVPSWQVIDHFESANDLLIGHGGLAGTFDPVCDRPYCVQWATVKRKAPKNGGTLEAAHEPGFADDLQRTVRASVLLAREATRHRLATGVTAASHKELGPHMTLYWPLLVVDAPVYSYDPHTSTLARNDWITLHLSVDLGGRVFRRPIDVVSLDGLATMIDAYKAVADQIDAWLKENVRNVAMAAHGQVLVYTRGGTIM